MFALTRPSSRSAKTGGLAVLLAFLAPPTLAAGDHHHPAPVSPADQHHSEVLADQLVHLTQVLPAAAIGQPTESLLADAAPAVSAGARRLAALKLRGLPPTPAARRWIDTVRAQAATYVEPHPESAAALHDPLGVAAAAQGTRNGWVFDEVFNQLRAGDLGALAGLAARYPDAFRRPALRGARAALAYLPDSTLNQPALAELVINEPGLGSLLPELARLTGDTRFLSVFLERAPDAERARAILNLHAIIGPDAARAQWLNMVRQREPQASLAVTALAQHFGSDPQAWAGVRDALADEALGVAALHAAARFDPHLVAPDLTRLRDHANPLLRQRAVAGLARLEVRP